MTVTYNGWKSPGAGLQTLSWESDLSDPIFQIFRGGELVATTTASSWTFSVQPGEQITVGVTDDGSNLTTYPDRITLHWYVATDATHYRVEQQIGGEWIEQATIRTKGEATLAWQSGQLADSQTHTFRVIPISAAGNEGSAREFSGLLVRIPDAPAGTIKYNKITQLLEA